MVRKSFIVMVLAAVTLSGCAFISLATHSNFHLTEELRIENPKRDPIKVAEEVGTEMGFSVVSRMPGMLMLSGDTNLLVGTITGIHKFAKIAFTDYSKVGAGVPKGQVEGQEFFKDRYTVMVMVGGGFGAGTESEAKTVMNEFKQKLLQKLDASKDPRDK